MQHAETRMTQIHLEATPLLCAYSAGRLELENVLESVALRNMLAVVFCTLVALVDASVVAQDPEMETSQDSVRSIERRVQRVPKISYENLVGGPPGVTTLDTLAHRNNLRGCLGSLGRRLPS